MFDTNVLIYGLNYGQPFISDDLDRKRRDSRKLLLDSRSVTISAVSYMEFHPQMTAVERQALQELPGELNTLEFGAMAAHLASRLMRKHGSSTKVCQRCLNPLGTSVCKGCNGTPSFQSRRNDYCIVATAAVARDVDVLYSYDFLYLADDVADQVTIVEPPDVTGAMFEGRKKVLTHEEVAAQISAEAKARRGD